MKNLFLIFALIGFISFQACEGPEGPIGPEGPQGAPLLGSVIEYEVDFNAANDYINLVETPFILEESDALLVYRLSGVENGLRIWRLLPQTYFFQEGVLQYNFDYTTLDVSIFLDGAIDLTTLPDQWTDNQIFRLVVVPSDFVENRIDFNNYEAVMQMLGITEADFKRIDSKKNN